MSLRSENHPLASTVEQFRILSNPPSVSGHSRNRCSASGLHPLSATGITTLQINLGKLCNQTCHHCHVDAGPDRKEMMGRPVAEACIEVLRQR